MKRSRTKRTARRIGTHIVWPAGVEERYGISKPTRWRWERDGLLPPRDVFNFEKRAIGWKPSTLDALDAGTLQPAS